MKCRLPMRISTPSGGGTSYPDGAFIPVKKFTAGKSYALVAKIDGVYRYINTEKFNDYTLNATEVSVTPGGGYVTFGSEPALFKAEASGDGFTLSNGDNYLYGYSDQYSTALRYDASSSVWTVDTSETGGFESGKYLPKEVASSVWLKNASGDYEWSIKYESAGSFGYDRAGRDSTYSTGFVSFILYEKWEGQTGGGGSGGDSGGGDDSLDYHDNFADNDWATIAKVCAEGLVPTTWKVGDQKAMTINGTSYPIDIIGIQHDDYADGSGKAPFTFQLHDCYGTQYAMGSGNAGGWRDCTMRKTHLPSILTTMPSDVQAAIKEVNKKTSAGNQSTTINTTADKLFLLAEIEVFGSITHSVSGEGSQYAYYRNGGSKSKKFNGSNRAWWERSPRSTYTTEFCYVLSKGTAGCVSATSSYGAAFAFCLGNPVSGGSSGGGSTPSEYAISVTGTGHVTYCYLTINGTEVTNAGTYAITAGTSVSVYVKSANAADSEIILNGTTVFTAGKSGGTYNYKPASNATINLISRSTGAQTVTITEE